jgi:hypothetical protein
MFGLELQALGPSGPGSQPLGDVKAPAHVSLRSSQPSHGKLDTGHCAGGDKHPFTRARRALGPEKSHEMETSDSS